MMHRLKGMPRQKLAKVFTALVIIALLPQAYQNCSPTGFQVAELQSKEQMTEVDHPVEKEVAPPAQAVQLGHKHYVSAMLREVFAGPQSSAGYLGALDAHIRYWIDNKGSQFGAACNQYDSNGVGFCDNAVSNVNGPLRLDDNLVRESFRIRACEEILHNDEAVAAALSKIQRTSETPELESLEQAAGLFYRGEPPPSGFVETLLELDRDLAKAKESVGERWRMMFIMICESPDWQMI
jgi:hypothetical protein